MIGLVLAAGAGRRLRPHTDLLPKTLLPVDGDTTILDIALHNLAATGITRAVIVVGFAAEAVEVRLPLLAQRHGMTLRLVYNEMAEVWNNAYSLWCGLQAVDESVLLVNGDTVHPPSVEECLLLHRRAGIVLAVDRCKPLAEEEMKVELDGDGSLRRIAKTLDPLAAHGEYIGVSLIESTALPALQDALRTTFMRDGGLYYEDAYQWLVDHGGRIGTAAIAAETSWVEVDNPVDLDQARRLACLY